MSLTIYGAGQVRDVQVDGKPIKGWRTEKNTIVVPGVPWTTAVQEVKIQYASR
jgi:hypothetical protein